MRSGMQKHLAEGKWIVLSQPADDSGKLARTLAQYRAKVHVVTALRFSSAVNGARARKIFDGLDSFGWVVFTSARAVGSFADSLRETNGKVSLPRAPRVAAVGPVTAAAVRKHDLPVHFVPKKAGTAKQLALGLDGVQGKRILLPRARVATPELPRILKARGAKVTALPMYTARLERGHDTALSRMALSGDIGCCICTSPSTVRGLIAKVGTGAAKRALLASPVFVIGPATGDEARRLGFKKRIVVHPHTKEGIVLALRRTHHLKPR